MIIKKNKNLSTIVLLKPLSSKSVIKLEIVDKNNIYRKFNVVLKKPHEFRLDIIMKLNT